ncbi:MAG TPA: hypothetical protein VGJ91_08815 [Polyangiaceae bacterium]|jgi:hypothetical protein
MSVLSLTCCSLLSAVCAFTLVSAAGCGTDAQGIDDCRQIEQARCAAAKNCGLISDVPACQRFYRDQCLHGLPVAPPNSARLKKCVETIQAAGTCATAGVDTPLSECDPQPTSYAPDVETTCDLVREPEKAIECSFLTPGVDAGVGGTSNAGGSGNAAGEAGSGGEGGS